MANPEQRKEFIIEQRTNDRKKVEHFITGQHVSLPRLKEQMQKVASEDPMMKYLIKEIPPYPTPVEFWVSDVTHVTNEEGIDGILNTEGFRGKFLWWELKMNEDEIKSAEKRYNKEHELDEEKKFLKMFTTSPPFTTEKSRFGNYRFTFPLTELMQWYKHQICDGEEPVLRVHETVTYKQEIMYTVLIHGPEANEEYKTYPLLQESEWVRYQDEKIIWKAQAICETHQYELKSGEVTDLYNPPFYVWDHVSLVFHLSNSTALKIPRERLIEALEACEIEKLKKLDLSKYQGSKTPEERFEDAKKKVSELKKGGRGIEGK